MLWEIPNVPGSGWRQISADFVAPSISVFTVADKDGTATVACNAASGCVPDLVDLGAGAYQEASTLNVFWMLMAHLHVHRFTATS